MQTPSTPHPIIAQFIAQERLPPEFAQTAHDYYLPLSKHIAQRYSSGTGTLVVGVNGAQGTGKSTLSLLLSQLLQAQQLRCVVISIDDLYLTRDERTRLAKEVHPLLRTRGVPGTHDLALGLELIAALKGATTTTQVAIPHFDKAQDERSPRQHWQIHSGAVDVILLEGWCVGARPTTLTGSPMNALERSHDVDGTWRRFVQAQLVEYQRLFAQIDLLVMLKAPSMECIVEWRTLQEHKLIAKLAAQAQARESPVADGTPNKGIMTQAELLTFIMHYERLTRYMLETMPEHADVVFDLDAAHRINSAFYRDQDAGALNQQWVLFTDLDGTLLEREGYSYAPALPALDLIKRRNIPLVLNSSKTVAEILSLRAELGNRHPFVAENGAAVIVPRHYFEGLEAIETLDEGHAQEAYCIKRFSQPHALILKALDEAKTLGFSFTGFSTWSAAELAKLCGMPEAKAVMAKQRIGSEPLLFEGDLASFIEFLATHQLRAVQGGRFLHVMGHYDKAGGVNWLLEAYRNKYKPMPIQTVALGDSHNDEGMLNTVDVPIVIRSPHSEQIILTHPKRARFSSAQGPTGWNEQLLQLLRERTHSTHP